jgi:O-antigen/teichoic acid export membrane protein
LNKNLGKQVKSGLGWDLGGTLFKQISTLIVTVVLARILSPEEFGIIGMAMVFISLSQVFVDVGFTQGLIQNQNNTQTIYSSVFYINIFLGLIMALSIFFLAPLIGNFYESSQVTYVVQWLCFVPLISSFGSIQNALFVKKLDFKTLTLRNIIGTVIGGVVGVTMALLDYGVYALVGQQLPTAIFFTSILWWKSDWIPSIAFSYKEVRELTNFSGYVFLDKLLQTFFNKLDTLFIGKYFSAITLGFYSRAESLNAQVIQYTTTSLGKVLFPAFSQLQNDNKLFESSYFKVFNIATFVATLASGSLFFLAEEIIINLLGDKWQPSVVIFQILVFKLLVSPFVVLMGKTLLAKGFSKQKFQISQINRVIKLTPIYFGYMYDIHAFTLALVVCHGIVFLINMWTNHKYLKISFSIQLLSFLKPIIPFMIMVFVYYNFLAETNSYLLFLIFLIIQFTYLYLLKNPGMYIVINLIKGYIKNK